ncbi:cold shock domain-containing protein [Paenibacillus frigoriresistens]|uniref:cold shock domain-containing protein n=1 Tax=Paenibacillus alginolyticus TaxID=59839 RepID=UPI001566D4B0|nr:cold shock domain-containing protein [Paenibacillus frigoriresistens]NRF94820.1 cold shock domain-containing protein [Paenibacillus frigoriresistens]
MDNVIIVCTNCSQQNRVQISSLHLASCGKCKNKLASSSSNSNTTETAGKIKWFSDEKGFGFIQDDAGSEYFFHIKSVNSTHEPKKGSAVTFNISQGKKGPEARDITITQVAVTSSDKPAKVLVLGDHRILLNKIKKYSLHETEITYRNGIQPPSGIFKQFVFDQSQLWSNKNFQYLYIQMFDGSTYYIYSDQETHKIYSEALHSFKASGLISNNYYKRQTEGLNEHHKKSLNQVGEMFEKDFLFVNDGISAIINKLDSAFNAIH